MILYATRFVFLRLFRPEDPVSLLYIAPRGLITILLFFQIGSNYPELVDTSFNGGILLVVILVTCIIMTVSLIQKGTGIEPVEVNKGQHLLFEAKAENSNLPEDVQPSEESPE